MPLQPMQNFNMDIGNPAETGFKGFNQGLSMAENLSKQITNQQTEDDYKRDTTDLLQNHTPDKMASVMLKYPQFSKSFSDAFKQMDAAKQQASFRMASPVYSAMLNKRPDIAKKLLTDQLDAMKNSNAPEQDQQGIEQMLKTIDDDPNSAMTQMAMVLSDSVGGPDNFAATYGHLMKSKSDEELAPYEQYKTKSEGDKAAADAGLKEAALPYADAQAQADLAKTQFEPIDRAQTIDINRQNAESNREQNRIQNENLGMQIGQNKIKQDESKLLKQQDYTKYMVASNLTTSAIDKVLNHPEINSNEIWRSARSFIPGSPAYDFKRLVDTVLSKNFSESIKLMTGMGQLSDAEGKKIQDNIAAIDTNMSNAQLKQNLIEIKKILADARERKKNETKKMEDIGAVPKGTVISPEKIAILAKARNISPQEAEQFLINR